MSTAHAPEAEPATPEVTRRFQPGRGLLVVVAVCLTVVFLALGAAVSGALGAVGTSAILGGLALILLGLGLLATLRVPARSLVVNAPRLRLERRRVAAYLKEIDRLEETASAVPSSVPVRDLVAPAPGELTVSAVAHRELRTIDVVEGPVATMLATSALGRAADERLAGTTTGETLARVLQLLAGCFGFILISLGLASVLGQVAA